MSRRERVLVACALLAHSCVNASETIQFKPVSSDVVEARLRQYAGNNRQRKETLKRLFSEAGCGEQRIAEQKLKGSKLPNVICTLPGSTGRIIIVGAHFDRVSDGDGVVDNWSGASLLPSLFEAVKAAPRKHTYIFIGFTDEERGEIGSKFFAQQMTKDQIAATDAMVNMDTLGLAPTEVWVSHADKGLFNALVYIAKQMNLPVSGVNVDYVGSSDSEQFSERKIPSLTIHSLTQNALNDGILHTSKDKLSAIHPDLYEQSYRLLSAYIAYLDGLGSAPTTAP